MAVVLGQPIITYLSVHQLHARVSSRNCMGGGVGGSVLTIKGGHDQMQNRCGFYSKFGYCEEVVEEFGGDIGDLGPTDERDSSFVCLICMQ